MEEDWQRSTREELSRMAKMRKESDYCHWLLLLTYVAMIISGVAGWISNSDMRLSLNPMEVSVLPLIAFLPVSMVAGEWIRLALVHKIR